MVKKIVASFLMFVVALSCSGCFIVSTSDRPNSSNGEGISVGDGKWEYSSIQTEAEEAALTLDNAEVKLVYAEGNYLLLAYYGPQQGIGMHYCNSDGTDFDFNPPDPFFWKFDNGWRLILTEELPETVDAASVGLSITDYSQESRPSYLFNDFGSPMSNSELQEIGVCMFNEHPANVTSIVYYNGWDIHIIIQFNWWGADRRIRVNSWPFTVDDFQLFTSDGTPLAEAYSDYNMEIKTIDNTGGALEIILSRDYDITEADIQALVDLEPYMIFTGDDGSALRIELLVSKRS